MVLLGEVPMGGMLEAGRNLSIMCPSGKGAATGKGKKENNETTGKEDKGNLMPECPVR